ncbi:MAG: hypothetical protein CM15mP84_06670 [Cellvibrionales bacterium]|nr:MAG: hypothetical protein CM15mP84_06670 [Cellvibrionales bacterium]
MSRSLPKILALGVVCGALILRPILASAETPLCELASPAEQALGVLASPSDFSFEGTLLLERAEGREFLAVKWPEPAGGGSLRRMNTQPIQSSSRGRHPQVHPGASVTCCACTLLVSRRAASSLVERPIV